MHPTMVAMIAWAQPAGAAAPASDGAPATGSPATAPASGASPAGPCGEMGGLSSLLFMLLIFAVFYFLLIRPQQKKAKEHQKMLDALQKGDDVVTSGGLVGRVTGMSDRFLTLEISEKVRVRVLRSQVAEKLSAATEKK